jgi:hypothetical protein
LQRFNRVGGCYFVAFNTAYSRINCIAQPRPAMPLP